MLAQRSLLSLLLTVLSIRLESSIGFSFLVHRTEHTNLQNSANSARRTGVAPLSTSADSVATEEAQDEVTAEDKNGDIIKVGTVVRVAVESLQAFQIPPKGRGTFNINKEFVAAPPDAGRASRNLLLPVGLRGVVTKIIASDGVTANFPIQVKFTPGENTDEGYDPPAAFAMHFDAGEIERT